MTLRLRIRPTSALGNRQQNTLGCVWQRGCAFRMPYSGDGGDQRAIVAAKRSEHEYPLQMPHKPRVTCCAPCSQKSHYPLAQKGCRIKNARVFSNAIGKKRSQPYAIRRGSLRRSSLHVRLLC